ncbi:hypothetical protein ACLGI4_13175 [Streptomyces sp. HMX112]|uniref:hypothetical protein n=1 Tax=Streptomyces sp. HMX112 TaxID=3390850 RepID=UPI003A7FEF90
MLQGAVADLRPSDGALDHLRRAVPARRARKRQALVGVAAAVLLLGTAVPAFVHVANSGDTAEDRPVNAGHGEQAQGGTGEPNGDEESETGTDTTPGTPSPGGAEKDREGRGKPQESASGTSDGTVGGTADPAVSAPPATPACAAGQLGVALARADEPDPEGKVYGTFRIANVSSVECVVGGAGSVGFQPTGAADPAKITVAVHTPGDPASGLPDPAGESPEALVLKPSGAYEVKFAWVPEETCPTNGGGGGGGASPDPSPSTGSGGGAPADGQDTGPADTQAQLTTADGTPADGGVTVTHTAAPGAPAAQATVPNACAGTIYHTDPLPTR